MKSKRSSIKYGILLVVKTLLMMNRKTKKRSLKNGTSTATPNPRRMMTLRMKKTKSLIRRMSQKTMMRITILMIRMILTKMIQIPMRMKMISQTRSLSPRKTRMKTKNLKNRILRMKKMTKRVSPRNQKRSFVSVHPSIRSLLGTVMLFIRTFVNWKSITITSVLWTPHLPKGSEQVF